MCGQVLVKDHFAISEKFTYVIFDQGYVIRFVTEVMMCIEDLSMCVMLYGSAYISD